MKSSIVWRVGGVAVTITAIVWMFAVALAFGTSPALRMTHTLEEDWSNALYMVGPILPVLAWYTWVHLAASGEVFEKSHVFRDANLICVTCLITFGFLLVGGPHAIGGIGLSYLVAWVMFPFSWLRYRKAIKTLVSEMADKT
jgi:hypothetical protein